MNTERYQQDCKIKMSDGEITTPNEKQRLRWKAQVSIRSKTRLQNENV
jgi:hypothetical protein